MCVAGVVIIKSETPCQPFFFLEHVCAHCQCTDCVPGPQALMGGTFFASFCKTTLGVVCLIFHPLFTDPDAFSPSCSPCRVTAKVIP